MKSIDLSFPEIEFTFPMTFVKGTGSGTYLFGATEKAEIAVKDFLISNFLVTQKLWKHVMGNNPSHFTGQSRPADTVSYNEITEANGFLQKLHLTGAGKSNLKFRLPSEAEWEYAARGGLHWKDAFQFSGSNNINDVAWYELNSGKYTDAAVIARLKNQEKGTETHTVATKLPNQLGIFDMCGNVWEWCEDYYQQDIHRIPKDGTAYLQETSNRVLRGGCHHNGAIHCTVSKRYEIVADAKDECIGFRIAASIDV